MLSVPLLKELDLEDTVLQQKSNAASILSAILHILNWMDVCCI